MSNLQETSFQLHDPPLEEVKKVLQKGLSSSFEQASVSVVECPDLREQPYNLVCKGLCGKECIADIGGECYLMPLPKKDKIYDIDTINRSIGLQNGFVIGAGAGPAHTTGNISEMIVNCDSSNNHNHIAIYPPQSDNYQLQSIDSHEMNLLANLYMSQGSSGQVLKIEAKHKRGEPSDSNSVFSTLRTSLGDYYGTGEGDPLVALGGVLVMRAGAASVHVMPCFPREPNGLRSVDDVKSWLTFHTVDAPFTSVGYLINRDNGHALRLEHFHGYNSNGQGGHFHHTVTPEEVWYEGYFAVPKMLYRIDEPKRKDKFSDD